MSNRGDKIVKERFSFKMPPSLFLYEWMTLSVTGCTEHCHVLWQVCWALQTLWCPAHEVFAAVSEGKTWRKLQQVTQPLRHWMCETMWSHKWSITKVAFQIQYKINRNLKTKSLFLIFGLIFFYLLDETCFEKASCFLK